MKRHKSLIPLSQDHHHGLMLAQLIKKGTPEYKGLPTTISGKINYVKLAWENELKIHFENEEKILFPAIKGKNHDIDKLIEEILEEHNQIKTLVSNLSTCEIPDNTLNDLGVLLEQHIRKEERSFFEKVQILLDKDLKALEGKIAPAKNQCST